MLAYAAIPSINAYLLPFSNIFYIISIGFLLIYLDFLVNMVYTLC